MWDRQIRNAVDAGDGDYQLRALREKVAAEPDNIPVRLELAKAYRERGYPDVALEICRLAAARFPESGEAQLALVRDLRDDEPPAAKPSTGWKRSSRPIPQSGAEYYSWLGILRDETGPGTPANRPTARPSNCAPAVGLLHNNLGYNLLMQKKNEEAARGIPGGPQLNPGRRWRVTIWAWRSPIRMRPAAGGGQLAIGEPIRRPRTTIWRRSGSKKGTMPRRARNWIWRSAIIGHTPRP